MPVTAFAAGRGGGSSGASNLTTLLALTLLFVNTAWLYQHVKHGTGAQQHHTSQLSLRGQHAQMRSEFTSQPDQAAAGRADGPVGSAGPASNASSGFGRLVGSQLTHTVKGGVLFSWGLDADYRMGRVGGDGSVPTLTLPHLQVVSVAASRHSLLVTGDRPAAVLSMGPNNSRGGGGHGSRPLDASGQLGRRGSLAPDYVNALAGMRVVQVASGRYHSLAVTALGQLLSWGLNDWGQLGRQVDAAAAAGSGDGSDSGSSSCTHGWACHSSEPGRVALPPDTRVVAAAAGRYSSLALDDRGQLWTYGYDGCASTGGKLAAAADAWQPRRVGGQLKGQRVVAFDVGYTFWLAATDDGKLFSCATGDDGYSGTLPKKPADAGQLGRTGPANVPGLVEMAGKQVVAVAAGREHALVATRSGGVFSFGGGVNGAALRGRAGPAGVPQRVAGALMGRHVRHVAAGEYYSLAATEHTVFGWGSNAFLCTGTGGARGEVAEPAPVVGELASGGWSILGLAAGYQNAFAIADKPGDARLAQQAAASAAAAAAAARAGAAAGAASGSNGNGTKGVEVVLTDKQLRERQRQQAREQQQQQAAQQKLAVQALEQQPAVQALQPLPTEASTQGPRPRAPVAPPEQQQEQQAVQAASFDAAQATAAAAAAAAVSTAPASPDWHTSYLAKQPPPPASLTVQAAVAAASPAPWRPQLVALSGDVFAGLPQAYNAEHRNPCWGGTGPELACLPFFQILGVSKCGTTDLYHRLTRHKLVLPATNKGPHFWDECPFPAAGPCGAGASGDFAAYVRLFSRAADLIRSRPDAITGEASSNTYTSANGVYLRGFRGDKPWSAWAGLHGANVSMPALLREALPYSRLIVMLRDPAHRYHSAFYYYRWWLANQTQPTADDFHAQAEADVAAWHACVASHSHSSDDCVRRYQPQQLVKGMYSAFLQDWLRHWPRNQLLLLRYEDYVAALPQHLAAVLAFLGVPQPDAATWAAMTSAPVQNQRRYPAMRPDTRALLRAFYSPFNDQLAAALGGDARWLWRDAADDGNTSGASV